MANSTTTNPLRYDTTTGASWTGTKFVRLIQWVDDNEDLADGDGLSMTINGCTVDAEVQLEVTANFGVVGPELWSIGPFNPGIAVKDFAITVLDHGAVYVWVD